MPLDGRREPSGVAVLREISYGVYLIHTLVFDLENYLLVRLFLNSPAIGGHFTLMLLFFAVAVIFTVAIAYLSRWYFEEPLLQLKRRFERHSPELVAAAEPNHAQSA